MVAIYTMVAWWIGRILATRGGMTPQEAHRRAYNAVEWLLEQSFDSRKGGSEMSVASFDGYHFAEILMRGGEDLPLEQLRAIGAPETTLSTLALAWRLANSYLRDACAESPVYEAFVLRRSQMEPACDRLLSVLREHGVSPAAVYRHIVDDLFQVTGHFPTEKMGIPEVFSKCSYSRAGYACIQASDCREERP